MIVLLFKWDFAVRVTEGEEHCSFLVFNLQTTHKIFKKCNVGIPMLSGYVTIQKFIMFIVPIYKHFKL